MRHQKMKQIFVDEISRTINTERIINDGSAQDGNIFMLSSTYIDGIADNLASWWGEKYDDTELTNILARQYFNEIYPEA